MKYFPVSLLTTEQHELLLKYPCSLGVQNLDLSLDKNRHFITYSNGLFCLKHEHYGINNTTFTDFSKFISDIEQEKLLEIL